MSRTRRPRLKGDECARKAQDLRRRYLAGSTIRGLSAADEIPYGTVRALLLEVKTPMRRRGGSRSRTTGA